MAMGPGAPLVARSPGHYNGAMSSPPPLPAASHPIVEELELLVRARYPMTWMVTHEERRAERLLREAATRLQREIVFWSCTTGLEHPAFREDTRTPIAALDAIRASSERRMFVLRDLHAFVEDPHVVRKLRDVVRDLRTSYKTLLVTGPVLKIPPELEKDVTVLDLPLPAAGDLESLLRGLLAAVPRGTVKPPEDPELFERVIKAALGLTEAEAENIFAKAIVSDATLGEKDISLILGEKKQVLRKSAVLEYFESPDTLGAVGGVDRLKAWLADRSHAFSEKARAYGLPAPRGVLLLGVQGCGKSLTAKCIAAEWKMPLLRLDIGRLFSSFIGASEANMHVAIKTAESLAPAILWVDEIEKGLSGTRSSGQVDAGTTARVFATLLTWLQEKTAPVFVVATANQIRDLPPELLRKGRFDEIFFIDLPELAEREQIFRIHLARRRRDPARFDVPALARATNGWSGAEIEQAVLAGLHAAFPLDRDVSQDDLMAVISDAVPLSRTMAEDMGSLREWAATRARPA